MVIGLEFVSMRARVGLLLVVPMLIGLVGCSGAESTVTGRVTLDGTSMDTGVVTFHPISGGPVAYGAVQTDGSYEVKTGARAGLAAGDYVITVMANAPIEVTNEIPKSGMEPVGESLVPDKYMVKQLTDLKASVSPGSNTVDLAMSSN